MWDAIRLTGLIFLWRFHCYATFHGAPSLLSLREVPAVQSDLALQVSAMIDMFIKDIDFLSLEVKLDMLLLLGHARCRFWGTHTLALGFFDLMYILVDF